MDGNRVYTVDICAGLTRDGFLWTAPDEHKQLSYSESNMVRVCNIRVGILYTGRIILVHVIRLSVRSFVCLSEVSKVLSANYLLTYYT